MWYIANQWNMNQSQKLNEALIHTTTQMNLENAILSERSRTQKVRQCVFHFYKMSRISKSRQKIDGLARDGQKGELGLTVNS